MLLLRTWAREADGDNFTHRGLVLGLGENVIELTGVLNVRNGHGSGEDSRMPG